MLDSITNNPASLNSLSSGTQSSNLGDLFFKLFSAELTQQNPLSPMDNQEWVQQFVELSSFNQMVAVNQQLSSLQEMLGFFQAGSLVGKEVAYRTEMNEAAQGTVEAVTQKNGQIFLVVDKKEIPLSWITEMRGAKS